jgi:dTDP-4-amino-4,6-dideoxygalactose transaminase
VRVPDGVNRDDVTKQLNANGVGARIYYPLPIHRQPVYQQTGRYDALDLPETERAVKEVFSLPIYPALSHEELEYVVEEVNALC